MYLSTMSFQYGQSCAQPSHISSSAGTPFCCRTPARRFDSSTCGSSRPVALMISVLWGGRFVVEGLAVDRIDAPELQPARIDARCHVGDKAEILPLIEAAHRGRKDEDRAPRSPKTSSSISRPRAGLHHLRYSRFTT